MSRARLRLRSLRSDLKLVPLRGQDRAELVPRSELLDRVRHRPGGERVALLDSSDSRVVTLHLAGEVRLRAIRDCSPCFEFLNW